MPILLCNSNKYGLKALKYIIMGLLLWRKSCIWYHTSLSLSPSLSTFITATTEKKHWINNCMCWKIYYNWFKSIISLHNGLSLTVSSPVWRYHWPRICKCCHILKWMKNMKKYVAIFWNEYSTWSEFWEHWLHHSMV